MGFTDSWRSHRAMEEMRRDHARWAKDVTPGSVWYSKVPTSEWNRFGTGGHGTPVYDRYEFVSRAPGLAGGGWVTRGGGTSWAFWLQTNGVGFTQERQITMQDCEAAAERLFEKQARHMQQAVGRAAGWDPSWERTVERVLTGV